LQELELCPSTSNVDNGVLLLYTPPTSINGEEVDGEDDSDSEDQHIVDGQMRMLILKVQVQTKESL
jgi:hypothetical protein